jgi:dienelactone hydrolase
LLFDLLNAQEGQDRRHVFDITLLARRLAEAVDWAGRQQALARLPLGLLGASTGAAAALVASALRPGRVHALVCRGGRPDLAASALPAVTAPTLMIVGGTDLDVLDLNQQAIARMRAPVRLKIIPGASHLFEEPGALDRVALLAAQWFRDHFPTQLPARLPVRPPASAGAPRDAVVEQAGPVLAERGERRLRAERRQWPRPAGAALAATLGSNRRPFRAGR